MSPDHVAAQNSGQQVCDRFQYGIQDSEDELPWQHQLLCHFVQRFQGHLCCEAVQGLFTCQVSHVRPVHLSHQGDSMADFVLFVPFFSVLKLQPTLLSFDWKSHQSLPGTFPLYHCQTCGRAHVLQKYNPSALLPLPLPKHRLKVETHLKLLLDLTPFFSTTILHQTATRSLSSDSPLFPGTFLQSAVGADVNTHFDFNYTMLPVCIWIQRQLHFIHSTFSSFYSQAQSSGHSLLKPLQPNGINLVFAWDSCLVKHTALFSPARTPSSTNASGVHMWKKYIPLAQTGRAGRRFTEWL